MPKMLKKKEIVNDEILNFNYPNWFWKKKTIVLETFFDKISDPYNKTTQKF